MAHGISEQDGIPEQDGVPQQDGVPEPGGLPRSAQVLVAAGAVLAVLLLGAAAGLLFGQRQVDANAAPAPDSVDAGFCQDKSVHHRQAATMAALARQRTSDARLHTLAFDIETSQIEQIGRMQGWLSLWGRDRLPTGPHMAWMTAENSDGHGAGHGGSTQASGSGGAERMPGMATPQELERLSKASGAEFDVLFLQLMLRHHQGGTTMLRYAADHAEVGVVRNLAAQMLNAQSKEIDYITAQLAARGAAPLPN